MSVNLSPIGNGINFLTTTGQPLAGGKLYTYQAGSSTPLTTYTDNNGLIANTNPIILGTDGRLPSELWLTYGYNYKFALQDANSNAIATYDNLYGILGSIPSTGATFSSGMIILWKGAVGAVPAGFALCNGANGTPDLRDRFIVGAGNLYAVNATGGSADAVVVSHIHTATSTSTVTDPGHIHGGNVTVGGPSFLYNGSGSQAYSAMPSAVTGITVATATTTSAPSGSVVGTNANNPLYYALAYIMAL